jgi:hypothetical protein
MIKMNNEDKKLDLEYIKSYIEKKGNRLAFKEFRKEKYDDNLWKSMDKIYYKKVFKILLNSNNGKDVFHHYVTSGLNLDSINAVIGKINAVPIPMGFMGSKVMAHQNNVILMQNPSSGKTTTHQNIGFEIGSHHEATKKYLGGGAYNNEIKQGALQGDGYENNSIIGTLLDEKAPDFKNKKHNYQTEDISNLLNNVLEQGTDKRFVGMGHSVKTTKPICIAMNLKPISDDLIRKPSPAIRLRNSMKIFLSGNSDPVAKIRRFNPISGGSDLKVVSASQLNSNFDMNKISEILKDSYLLAIRKNKKFILNIFELNRNKLSYLDSKYMDKIDYLREKISDPKIRSALKGFNLSAHKINLGVIKWIIGENIPSIVLNSKREVKKQIMNSIEEKYDLYHKQIQKINIQTLKNLQGDIESDSIKDQIIELYQCKYSPKEIMDITGISRTQVYRIIKENKPTIGEQAKKAFS